MNNKQNISTIEETMTRAEYYKYMGLSGSPIDRPNDIADETFKIHCNQLANFANQFIDFCKSEDKISNGISLSDFKYNLNDNRKM